MELVDQTKDAATVKRVFGEPIHHGDITVIPVARIAQGGGGGSGSTEADQPSQGSGGGFGFGAAPAGVFVVKDGEVKWQPVVDVNRIVLGAQIVGIVLLLTIRTILKKRRRHR